MKPAEIHVSSTDHHVIRLLLARQPDAAHARLVAELDRAIVLEPAALPPGTIGLNCRVRLLDQDSGDVEEYLLTLPARAETDERRLSILAPVGTALLGYHTGDEIEWPTPGGRRRLKVLEVTPEPPAPVSILDRLRPNPLR